VIVRADTEWSQLGWAVLIVVAAFAGLGALAWVYFTEPWYSKKLIERMRGGVHQAPWRDETARISDLFPDGMSQDAAVTLLRQNGFSCGQGDSADPPQIACTRKVSGFPCTLSYVVNLVLDRDSVRGRNAQSYAACL
jgi:hypothetical protein